MMNTLSFFIHTRIRKTEDMANEWISFARRPPRSYVRKYICICTCECLYINILYVYNVYIHEYTFRWICFTGYMADARLSQGARQDCKALSLPPFLPTHTHIHTYIHTHTHQHTHMHMHIRTHTLSPSLPHAHTHIRVLIQLDLHHRGYGRYLMGWLRLVGSIKL